MTGDGPFTPTPLTEPTISDLKKERIMSVVDANGGDLNRASVVLGISASSLRRRIEGWKAQNATQDTTTGQNPTRKFYDKIKNPWSVRSFDTDSKEVCIEIRNPSATVLLAYTAPSYKTSAY